MMVAIFLELAFPDEVGADILPLDYDDLIQQQIARETKAVFLCPFRPKSHIFKSNKVVL